MQRFWLLQWESQTFASLPFTEHLLQNGDRQTCQEHMSVQVGGGRMQGIHMKSERHSGSLWGVCRIITFCTPWNSSPLWSYLFGPLFCRLPAALTAEATNPRVQSVHAFVYKKEDTAESRCLIYRVLGSDDVLRWGLYSYHLWCYETLA